MEQAKKFLEKHGFFDYKSEEFVVKIREHVKNAENGEYNLEYKKKNPKALGKKLLAMELGGTNLRLSLVDFQDKIEILKSKQVKFFENRVYTPEILFSNLWEHIKEFLDGKIVDDIAFVFSYPQKNEYADGKLNTTVLNLAKEIKHENIANMNITGDFKEFLREKIGDVDLVVINDATAGVLCLKYLEDFENENISKKINLIVGTGYNIAYINEDENSVKIVNCEAGAFPSVKKTIFDLEVDKKVIGKHFFERMVAGKYIPMLFKEIVKELRNKEPDIDDMESMLEYIGENKELNYILEAIIERGAYMIGTVLKEIINSLEGDGEVAIIGVGSPFWHLRNYKEEIIKNIGTEVKLIKKEDEATFGCVYLLSQLE